MSSIFSLCLIWSMKAGVAVRLRCCISPPASCLAQVNGDTKAFKHIQALPEFAPVGDLDPGVSSSVLHGSYRERMTPGYWKYPEILQIEIEILQMYSICEVLSFWLLSVSDFERKALIVWNGLETINVNSRSACAGVLFLYSFINIVGQTDSFYVINV